jgi:pimeloyl-ACP methyl ester carboxylesterase
VNFVNIQGVDVFYQHSIGSQSGPGLLFIHGSGSSHEVWQKQMSTGLDSIALDLPGHGASDGKPGESIYQMASQVADFIKALELPRPLLLVGHSMGAAISLICAIEHIPGIDGIILIGAGPRMKVMPAFLEDLKNGKSDPDFIRLAFAPQAPPDLVATMVQAFAQAPTDVLFADFNACNNFDVSQQLEEIELPALIIAGASDKLTPLKLSEFISSHIENSQLEVISEAGHYVMLEQPEAVNQIIKAFAAKVI